MASESDLSCVTMAIHLILMAVTPHDSTSTATGSVMVAVTQLLTSAKSAPSDLNPTVLLSPDTVSKYAEMADESVLKHVTMVTQLTLMVVLLIEPKLIAAGNVLVAISHKLMTDQSDHKDTSQMLITQHVCQLQYRQQYNQLNKVWLQLWALA